LNSNLKKIKKLLISFIAMSPFNKISTRLLLVKVECSAEFLKLIKIMRLKEKKANLTK
jgi:hypothetical protein